MKRALIVFLLISNCLLSLNAQDSVADGLFEELNNATTDTGRVAILSALGMQLYVSDIAKAEELWQQQLDICNSNLEKEPNGKFSDVYYRSKAYALGSLSYVNQVKGNMDKAVEQTQQALEVFETINDPEGIAGCLNGLGIVSDFQGKTDEALVYYNRGFQLFDSIGKKNDAAMLLNNIALIYERKGNILQALETHHRAIKLAESIEDKRMLGNSYTNIGTIYQDQREPEKAYEYFMMGLEAREAIDDKEGLGKTYNELAYNFLERKDTVKALDYFKKSLVVRKEVGDRQGISQVQINLAKLLRDEFNQVDSAITLLNAALILKQETSDRQGEGIALNALAQCYFIKNNNNRARQFAENAFAIAQEINYPINIKNTSLMLSQIYANGKDFEKAYNMHVLHKSMADSIYNDNTQKAALRQEMKYQHERTIYMQEQAEKEKKQRENEIKQRRNNLQYSAILVAIVLLVMALLFLGRFNVSARVTEAIVFFMFLIFFEFCLVLLDPYIEQITNGEPLYKLLLNALIAGLIFPLHAFFENTLKKKVLKNH